MEVLWLLNTTIAVSHFSFLDLRLGGLPKETAEALDTPAYPIAVDSGWLFVTNDVRA